MMDIYVRWDTDDECAGAHTEFSVRRTGPTTSWVRIEDFPGSIVIELTVPTKSLVELAEKLSEEFG